jgi:hypothetical protein
MVRFDGKCNDCKLDVISPAWRLQTCSRFDGHERASFVVKRSKQFCQPRSLIAHGAANSRRWRYSHAAKAAFADGAATVNPGCLVAVLR